MLPRCLASVAGLVSEIVAVDTGSVDATPRLLAEAGAMVRHVAWQDDFSQARNAALAMVTRPWVLVLDADEALEQRRAGALAELLTADPTPTSYALPLLSLTTDDDDGPTNRTLAVRLFNRPDVHRWEGALHEQLRGSQPAVCPDESLIIRHWGYQPSVIAAKDKVARDRRLATDPTASMDPLMRTLMACRLAEDADEIGRLTREVLHLAQAAGRGDAVVHEAVGRWAAALAQARRWPELLTAIGEAVEAWPFLENQCAVWYWLGRAFAGIGDRANAKSAVETAWGLLHAVGIIQFYEDMELPARLALAMAESQWAAGSREAARALADQALSHPGLSIPLQVQVQATVAAWG